MDAREFNAEVAQCFKWHDGAVPPFLGIAAHARHFALVGPVRYCEPTLVVA
jgi:hypothetical protein